MDTRARIAIGGTTAFAVTAAVVATVAVTNTAVLAESPGEPVESAMVHVRPAPQLTVTPRPAAGPADVSAVTEPVTDPVVEPVGPLTTHIPAPPPAPPTEAAPPVDVVAPAVPHEADPPVTRTVPAPAPVVISPAAPPAAALPPAPATRPDRGDDGDRSHPARPDDHDDSYGREDRPSRFGEAKPRPQTSAPAVTPSVSEKPLTGDGSKRDRSHGSPDFRD
ncbi:hypothetical protein ACFC3F_04615 [Microbacterium sp. NPDC055910]|uniref:hypothetical protein n=1 Tax=Microbacterium sp. NPDC055910 TaxID=3345659 RepID=UPI0035DAC59C